MTDGGDKHAAEDESETPSVSQCWNAEALSVSDCERCPNLVSSRSRIVDGVGPKDADLVFVGEAPGATEDERGEPFVGRSGDVLDDQLRAEGYDRTDVRITNCVRCRPPENRDPTGAERDACRDYLARELDALDPELVVTLGKVPAEHLLDRSVAVTSEAGTIHDIRFEGIELRVLLSVHPAATLYDPGQREPFAEAVARAVEYAGDGGQSTLGSF